jgi:hypothetical protein
MKRRTAVLRLAVATLAPSLLAAALPRAFAQRPSQPIYRPIPGRPGRPLRPGRFYSGGTNYAPAAGVFTVSAVNSRDNMLTLRDEGGGSAEVYVNPRLFDLDTLKTGDEVAVDFFVPDDNDDRLEAASIDKLERIPQ